MQPAARFPISVSVSAAAVALVLLVHAAGGESGAGEHRVDFFKEVRPILAQHCFQCHGPDAAARKADLRLDLRDGAFGLLEDGTAPFVPGHPETSVVLARLTNPDPKQRMPKDGEPLSERQIDTIKKWLAQGGEWKDHWAFTAPAKHEPPSVADAAWSRDPLDRFVLARLERESMKPEPEATREEWLRRVTFDLTGLPPALDEIDRFVKDTTDGAYAAVVDRLLASPRYGERQAQEWLDVARYADTNGYQRDGARENWKWREWVIEAFNANMPFDRFTIEQLAGDLLQDATAAQKIATGFNRNHPTNSEGAFEEDEYRSAYVMDRVHTTATAFMGLTLACAQCHDHKYDPLSQKDFYAFYGFFNQVNETDADGFGSKNARPWMAVPSPDQAPRLADLEARIAALKSRLESDDPLVDAAQKQWEARQRQSLGEPFTWETLDPAGMLSKNGSKLVRQDDGSILSTGQTPVRDTYELVFQPGKKTIQALRLEVLPDPSNPGGKTGRADDGRFILSRLELRRSTLSESKEPPLVFVAKAQADINQEIDPDTDFYTAAPGDVNKSVAVEEAMGADGGDFRSFGRGWCIAGDAMHEPHAAVFIPLEPIELNEAGVLRIALQQTSQAKYKALVGRFRISITEDPRVRTRLMPVTAKLWSTVGPFPADHAPAAFETAYAPEAAIKAGIDLRKKFDAPKKPDDAKPADGKPDTKGKGPKNADEKNADEKGKPVNPDATPTAPAAEPPAPVPAASDAPVAADATSAASAPAAAKPRAKDGANPESTAESKQEANVAAEPGKPPAPKHAKTDAKTDAKGDASAKSDATAKPDEAAPPADAPAANESPDGDDPRGKRDDRLTWQEQKTWRDGDRQSFRGASGDIAYYLTRKLVADRARTIVLRLDGPAGVKVWLNGESVFSEAPPNPAPESKTAETKGAAAKAKPAGEEDGDEFDFGEFFAKDRGKRLVRIGIRAGENELVVKAIYALPKPKRGEGPKPEGMGDGDFGGFGGGRGRGGGASFTADVVAEGDDVLNFEVATLLREPAAVPAIAATPDAAAPAAAQTPQPVTSAGGGPMAPERTGAVASAKEITKEVAKPEGAKPELAKPELAKPELAKPELAKPEGAIVDATPPAVPDIGAKTVLTPEQRRAKALRMWYRRHIDPIGRVIAAEFDALEAERDVLMRTVPKTMVMQDRKAMRTTHLFKRGQYKNKGAEVASDVPSILPPLTKDLPRNRLGLARWLVAPEHPLTARVTINRIWAQYFGTGFVKSPDDFGVRSEMPSHPELLDTLAVEFRESGWDVKALHRRIVLSATYRQSSAISPQKLEKDPANTWLSRGPRLRLSAEMIRDNALFVAGLLVEKTGGKSVKPYQPKGLWKAVAGGREWKRDEDESQYRRGLYVFLKRGVPYPSMITFDGAKRETCTVSRPSTTTPLQALVLLNDPVFVEAAKCFGQRLVKEGGKDDAKRIATGFRWCTSRAPTDAEVAILTQLLAAQREHFKANADAAKKLLAVGDAKVDPKQDAVELAAWTGVAQTLLNLDATIHRG